MRTKNTCNTCTIFDRVKGEHTQTPDSECQIRNECPDDGSTIEHRSHRAKKLPVYPTGEEEDEAKQETKVEGKPGNSSEDPHSKKTKVHKHSRARRKRKSKKTKRRVSRQNPKKPKRGRRVGKQSKPKSAKMVKKK